MHIVVNVVFFTSNVITTIVRREATLILTQRKEKDSVRSWHNAISSMLGARRPPWHAMTTLLCFWSTRTSIKMLLSLCCWTLAADFPGVHRQRLAERSNLPPYQRGGVPVVCELLRGGDQAAVVWVQHRRCEEGDATLRAKHGGGFQAKSTRQI